MRKPSSRPDSSEFEMVAFVFIYTVFFSPLFFIHFLNWNNASISIGMIVLIIS